MPNDDNVSTPKLIIQCTWGEVVFLQIISGCFTKLWEENRDTTTIHCTQIKVK